MAAKKCRICGKANPHFFTHCVDCGAVLADDTKKNERVFSYLKIGLILCVSLVLIIFVILPVIQYSHMFGQDFSEKLSAKSAAESQPISEYSLDQLVENGGLRITINSAKNGQNTYNSNRFFMVSVYLENTRTGGNVQVSGNDFFRIRAGIFCASRSVRIKRRLQSRPHPSDCNIRSGSAMLG